MKLKKKKGVLIALAAICVSIVAFTSEPFDSSLVVVNQKSGVFQVIHQGAKAGKVLLKISDTIGKELFMESIKTECGAYPVTYVAMEPGEYTIQIIDEKGRQIQQIPYQIKNAHTGFQITKIADADDLPLPLSHPNN